MSQVLRQLPTINDPRVLVGFDGSDDAAVYQLDNGMAMISTLDFFTPMLDDPYVFGQIAAANALSDVYAMGGDPILALNIVCFPCELPPEMLGDILRGGVDKVAESGAVVIGGHSVEDAEPKYGMSVTGLVDKEKIWCNNGAKAGDALILTKPIGSGVLSTALRGGLLNDADAEELIAVMTTLNKYSADAVKMTGVPVNACTDITGFGLLGHLYEMTGDSLTAELYRGDIPLLKNALDMANIGMIPSGAYNNVAHLAGRVDSEDDVFLRLLCDPQTSGGLLFAIPEEYAQQALDVINEATSIKAAVVGRMIERRRKAIYVIS